MSRQGIGDYEVMNGPVLMPCGAFISARSKSERCQSCYGRRLCICANGTSMPCEDGFHTAPGSRRAGTSGRVNRGFVDINQGRPGMGSGR